MKRAAIVLSLIFAPLTASADVISHFADGPFGDVPDLLDTVGIGSGNVASETTATTFLVPGASGSVDLTFDFIRDTGSFLFTFGFFDVSAITADPITDKQDFALQALSAASVVFDDTTDNPGASTTLSVEAGTELGFFLIPNNTLAAFLASPASFFPSQTVNDPFRSPLFSIADANPGEFDQLLSFVASGITLFTFEDLTRSGPTDQDFTDLAFTIDVELVTVPEPTSSLVLMLAGLAAIGASRLRRR